MQDCSSGQSQVMALLRQASMTTGHSDHSKFGRAKKYVTLLQVR